MGASLAWEDFLLEFNHKQFKLQDNFKQCHIMWKEETEINMDIIPSALRSEKTV